MKMRTKWSASLIKSFRSLPVRYYAIYIAAYLSSTAGTFLDPQKAADDLHAFAKLNEGRLYKLFNTCMDTQTDLKALTKATVSSVLMSFTFYTHNPTT